MPTIKASERLGLTAPVVLVADESGWSRPSDWLTMPTLVDGDQKIVMLIAVYEHDSNFVAFKISGGNYTVDWGDGSAVESVNGGVQAERNLQWADFASSTLTSRGYRQALVTIEAQSGQTLTFAKLSEKHSFSASSYQSQTLQIIYTGIQLSATLFGAAESSSLVSIRKFFSGPAEANLSDTYRSGHSLRDVVLPDLSSASDIGFILEEAKSLENIEFYNLGSATKIDRALQSAESLLSCKVYGLANSVDATSFARYCYSLQSLEFDDASTISNTLLMLGDCRSLAKLVMPGLKIGISLENCKMSATALNDFMSGLGIPDSAQTIDVSGNWGAATCDPTIATTISSNWTVITS